MLVRHGRCRATVGLMPAWLSRSTVIAVALPPERAIDLFTPEGERKWSEGWKPVYPRPGRTAGPGAVFVTGHDGHETIWTMVDHTAACVRYARVTPGVAAGTVTVTLEADGAGRTRAKVTYDLTSLSADGRRVAGGLRRRLRRRHRRVGNRNRRGARLRRLTVRRRTRDVLARPLACKAAQLVAGSRIASAMGIPAVSRGGRRSETLRCPAGDP